MASNTVEIRVNAIDNASKTLAGIGSSLANIGKIALGTFAGNLITKGLDIFTSALGNVKDAMIGGNAEFERYETQFGVLLKSTDKAKERLAMLADFGAKTPFELPELVRADKILTAFGLHSETTAAKFGVSGEQILKTIGDVASGTGANFEELSVTFGKFASGATGEAIARFQELGIATREEMAGWGLEFSKSGQLLTPVTEAFTVLESHVRQKFGGMMDAQSMTFEGMVSNLNDWLGQTGRLIGKPIFDVLKNQLGELMAFLNSDAVKVGITSFATALAGFISSVITGITRIGEIFGTFGFTFAAFKQIILTTFSPEISLPIINFVTGFQSAITIIIGVIQRLPVYFEAVRAAVVNAFGAVQTYLAQHGTSVQGVLINAWNTIQTIITGAVNTINQIITTVFAAINEFMARHGSDIQATISVAWGRIQSIIQTIATIIREFVIPTFQKIGEYLNTHGSDIQSTLTNAWNAIKLIIITTLNLIDGILKTTLAIMRGDWSAAWEGIKQITDTIWNAIKTLISVQLQLLRNAINNWIEGVNSVWRAGWDLVKSVIMNILDAIVNVIENKLSEARAIALDIIGALPALIRGLVSGFVGAGEAIINGLIQGVTSAAQGLANAAANAARAALDAAKAALGIHSPSAEFAYLGEMSGAGFEIAFVQKFYEILQSLKSSIDQMISAMSGLTDRFAGFATQIENAIARMGDVTRNELNNMATHAANTANNIANSAADIAGSVNGAINSLADLQAVGGIGGITGGTYTPSQAFQDSFRNSSTTNNAVTVTINVPAGSNVAQFQQGVLGALAQAGLTAR